MWQSSNTIRAGHMHRIALRCLEGSTPQDRFYKTSTCRTKRFIPVYRLGEDGDLLKEGADMLSVWVLRARSYKNKAKA